MNDSVNVVIDVLRLLSDAVDAKDPYTRGHSERVKLYSLLIADELGLSQRERKILSLSAELHDIGKSKILDEILKKPSRLNEEERLEIYRHPLYSVQIIKNISGFEEIAEIILNHHEYCDGSGYPSGIKGEKIPLLSKIITVSDVFDAMTSRRVYRRRTYSDKEAIKLLKKKSGILYDPDVVKAFVSVYEKGYVFMERGNYYFNHHFYFNAMKHYKLALERMKDTKKIYMIKLRMAEIHNRQRNFKEAITLLEEGLIEKNPYLGNYYLELTLSYHYMDNLKLMGRYVKLALKEKLSFPDRLRGLRHLLIYYHRTGKPEKALELYREIEIMISRFSEERKKENLNVIDLSEEISMSRAIDQERSKLYDYVARVMRDLGFLNESINLFEKSIELKTILGDFFGKTISLGGLGEVYILLGEYKTAFSVVQESLSLSKMTNNKLGIFLSHLKLLEITSLMKDFDQAKRHLNFLMIYRKNILIKESVQRLGYAKGIYYLMKGENKKAIENLLMVEKTSNNIIRKSFARLYLAKAYKNIGNYKKSKRYYRKCLQIFNKYHMHYLARIIEEETTSLIG